MQSHRIEIDLTKPLDQQINDIKVAVNSKNDLNLWLPKPLPIYLQAKYFRADQKVVISDNAIKALIGYFGINEYREAYSDIPKYTFSEVTKSKSDFFTRNWGTFTAGLTVPPAVVGGALTGLFLLTAIAPPFGLAAWAAIAIGAAAVFAVSAIVAGVTYLVKSKSEQAQLDKQLVDMREEAQRVHFLVREMDPLVIEQKREAKKRDFKNAKEIADKINEIKQFPADCISSEDGQMLLSDQLRASGDANVVLAKVKLKDIKSKVVRAYVNKQFDKLTAELKDDFQLSLLSDDKRLSVMHNLQFSIEEARKKMLSDVAKLVNANTSGDEIKKVVDDAYRFQFACRLANVIHYTLYNGEGVVIKKRLETDPLAGEACDKVMAEYVAQANARVSRLAIDLERINLADLPAREKQEKEYALAFNREMQRKLDAILKPEALAAARREKAKADITAARQDIAEIERLLPAVVAIADSLGVAKPVVSAPIEEMDSQAKGVATIFASFFGSNRVQPSNVVTESKPAVSPTKQ